MHASQNWGRNGHTGTVTLLLDRGADIHIKATVRAPRNLRHYHLSSHHSEFTRLQSIQSAEWAVPWEDSARHRQGDHPETG
jgi:hypothetical protein